MNGVNRFLGDSPIRVLIKLSLISFLVGIVMTTFGWTPADVVYAVRSFFLNLWNMGFRAVDRFLGTFLIGAAIVVPAFIVLRLISYRR